MFSSPDCTKYLYIKAKRESIERYHYEHYSSSWLEVNLLPKVHSSCWKPPMEFVVCALRDAKKDHEHSKDKNTLQNPNISITDAIAKPTL